MSEWKRPRFWKETTVVAAQERSGWTIALDGRHIKTPAKSGLVLPTPAMAEAVAQEWDAQQDQIDPSTMPVTRAANSAIDKVAVQFDEVAGLIADYADSDLLCYRAEAPAELTSRQAQAWDPLLDWAAERFDARLTPVTGIMHKAQDPRALSVLRTQVRQMTEFELTGFSDLVALSGSLVIGFAAVHNVNDPGNLFDISHIDEAWQEQQWGRDDEAHEVMQIKRREFLAAKHFFDLATPPKQ